MLQLNHSVLLTQISFRPRLALVAEPIDLLAELGQELGGVLEMDALLYLRLLLSSL